MKRPILIAVIGYIIGIIVGLYFKISIVFLYIPIIAVYLIIKKTDKKKNSKLKLFSIKRYIRYIKIYINSQIIILLIISSILSNLIVISKNKQYEMIYNELENKENISFQGIVISEKQEKQYYNKYQIRTTYNGKKINFYITTSKDIELKYGNEIFFSGIYTRPECQRNYKGYDYSKYLKQLNIYGTIKCEKIKCLNEIKLNKIFIISHQISNKIISNTKELLSEETSSILLGLILGYKQDIDEKTQENFRNASMSHILAVSGMHVTYIVLGINIILKKIIGKKNTHILNIVILILYMFITNFTPSITRAGVMGIIMIFSKLIYRKNDIYTSLSISLLIILIYNPFLIQNLGLLLSYGGVLGIIFFNKSIFEILKKSKIRNKNYKYKIEPKVQKYLNKIKEIISISLSVQIVILPITIYNLNTFNPYFLISNLILNIFIGPIVIIGFLFIIIVSININIAKYFSQLINFLIKILYFLSKLGELKFSKIYISTPNLFLIITYYFFIIILFAICNIYLAKKPNITQIRIKNLIALVKIKIRANINKIKKIFIVLFLIIFFINLYPKDLKIYFIDVGQGDSCLIITPKNKTILIDGGGSTSTDFDVGKNTLIPYILDRGYTKIDIVIISHFDNDHIGGILTLLEEIKVDKIYISKQIESSSNYNKFIETVDRKKIKVYEVISGNRINIEKNLYFDILWPTNQQITTNILNNNSIVFNLHYNNFCMLFTGDIEEIAEKEILETYLSNKKMLKSDILKVAHHGSKTSSSKEFLDVVNPKIAIIGVGKNNNFGHPNNAVIDRLKKLNCKILRTDLNGEITIKINKRGKISYKSKM